MCPINIDSMILQGGYTESEFNYVSFKILGCNLKEECLSDVDIAKETVNFVTLNSYPNILG